MYKKFGGVNWCSGEQGKVILNLWNFLFPFDFLHQTTVGWKILGTINIYFYFAQELNFGSYLQSKSQSGIV